MRTQAHSGRKFPHWFWDGWSYRFWEIGNTRITVYTDLRDWTMGLFFGYKAIGIIVPMVEIFFQWQYSRSNFISRPRN